MNWRARLGQMLRRPKRTAPEGAITSEERCSNCGRPFDHPNAAFCLFCPPAEIS